LRNEIPALEFAAEVGLERERIAGCVSKCVSTGTITQHHSAPELTAPLL